MSSECPRFPTRRRLLASAGECASPSSGQIASIPASAMALSEARESPARERSASECRIAEAAWPRFGSGRLVRPSSRTVEAAAKISSSSQLLPRAARPPGSSPLRFRGADEKHPRAPLLAGNVERDREAVDSADRFAQRSSGQRRAKLPSGRYARASSSKARAFRRRRRRGSGGSFRGPARSSACRGVAGPERSIARVSAFSAS